MNIELNDGKILNKVIDVDNDDVWSDTLDAVDAVVRDGSVSTTIDDDEKDTLNNYCNVCNDSIGDKYVNKYLVVEYEDKLKDDCFNDLLDSLYNEHTIAKGIMNAVYRMASRMDGYKGMDNTTFRDTLLKVLTTMGIKGVRDTHSLDTLIKTMMGADVNITTDMLGIFYDRILDKGGKWIFYVGNDSRAKLTSSYSDYYGSCFRLNKDNRFSYDGCYRSSNLWMMGDDRVYIIKAYSYNDDNVDMMNADTLKYSDKCISRKWMYKAVNESGNVAYVVNKSYGDRTLNVIDRVVNAVKLALDINDDNVGKLDSNRYNYSLDRGYNGYDCFCEYKYMIGDKTIDVDTPYRLNDAGKASNDAIVDARWVGFGDISERIIAVADNHDDEVYSNYRDEWYDSDEAVWCDDIDDYLHQDDDDLLYNYNGDPFCADHTGYVVVDGDYYDAYHFDVDSYM